MLFKLIVFPEGKLSAFTESAVHDLSEAAKSLIKGTGR
jgi:hypothetical protein